MEISLRQTAPLTACADIRRCPCFYKLPRDFPHKLWPSHGKFAEEAPARIGGMQSRGDAAADSLIKMTLAKASAIFAYAEISSTCGR